jgi:hypothetical protein
VRIKASTNFIERTVKHPDGWDLIKELSQKKSEIQEMSMIGH